MSELDLATVAAANDAWVWAPDDAEVVETAEYRLVRLPERFPDPLQVQWVRSARPAGDVLEEIVTRAAGFGLPGAFFYAKLSAPSGFDEALLARGAELADTCDVLAMALPAAVQAAGVPGLEVRWRTTPEVARDANTVGTATFGGNRASDEEVARQAEADRESFASGAGGAVVAYVGGEPAGVGGLTVVDGVARVWGGGVLEAYRGQGVYRAMVAARLAYAAEHGATMALTQGRVTTSSPILQRLGFTSFGQERCYRLPLS
ncbi:GNAT family N-acetyltransferase [Longispora albida]|uniref:GNAT family N-acetyltransferase n=1 Tax=Longispora albida TaxID=203523 RepID=UPI0003775CF4|nr:GNAT family N-acetyltransferase [Longispora albida]